MSEVWTSAALGELCDFRAGLWKGDKGPLRRVSVLRNTNFTPSGKLDFSDVAQIDVEERSFLKRRLQPGDIILEKSGGGPKQPVGRVCLFDQSAGDFSFSNFTAALTIKNRNELEPRYLLLFLMWCYESGLTATMQSHSTGIRNLDGTAYKNISVPLPPLAEQQRIVAFLHEAFEEIANAVVIAETNTRNADAAFSVALSQDFERLATNAPMRLIGEVASKVGSGATPRGGRESYHASGVLLVRSLNVHDRTFRSAGSAYLDETQAAQLANVVIERGDVLLNITGASIARCCVVPEVAVGGRVNQHVSIIRPRREAVLSEYLVEALTSTFFKNRLLGIGEAAGSTRQALTKADILRFEIPVPSVDEQIAICRRASELKLAADELRAAYSARMALLSELKQSLLARAFFGEQNREPLAA